MPKWTRDVFDDARGHCPRGHIKRVLNHLNLYYDKEQDDDYDDEKAKSLLVETLEQEMGDALMEETLDTRDPSIEDDPTEDELIPWEDCAWEAAYNGFMRKYKQLQGDISAP